MRDERYATCTGGVLEIRISSSVSFITHKKGPRSCTGAPDAADKDVNAKRCRSIGPCSGHGHAPGRCGRCVLAAPGPRAGGRPVAGQGLASGVSSRNSRTVRIREIGHVCFAFVVPNGARRKYHYLWVNGWISHASNDRGRLWTLECTRTSTCIIIEAADRDSHTGAVYESYHGCQRHLLAMGNTLI